MRKTKFLTIPEAARSLEMGQVVAIPTETVYGLAACALNEKAVNRIFSIKKRPKFNPIICHFSNKEQVLAFTKKK